jgi:hypothetical protein
MVDGITPPAVLLHYSCTSLHLLQQTRDFSIPFPGSYTFITLYEPFPCMCLFVLVAFSSVVDCNMSYNNDTSYEKSHAAQGAPMHAPVVAAHAVNAYSVQSGPTVAAAPVSHQPAYAQNTTPNHVFSTRPPPGRWADGICDWPKNMFPSCYCACCCCYGMWLSAQSKLPAP